MDVIFRKLKKPKKHEFHFFFKLKNLKKHEFHIQCAGMGALTLFIEYLVQIAGTKSVQPKQRIIKNIHIFCP